MAGTYIRTAAHRTAIAASNSRTKRKYHGEHGLHSRLYVIWKAMHLRCYYPSHEAYDRYGGRGITVCDQWRDNYLTFRDWALSSGYGETLTIDRIDNAKGYDPVNSRWVSMGQQQRNRRDALPPVTVFGETKSLIEWADDPRCVVNYMRLWSRVKAGTPLETALTAKKVITPRKPHSSKTKRKISEARLAYFTRKESSGDTR